MSAARTALSDGRLSDAIREQQAATDADPSPAARLFLFELLVLADRLTEAGEQLDAITSDDPAWLNTRRRFVHLLRAVRRRNHLRRRPRFFVPPPVHACRRWNAARAVEAGDAVRGVRWIDQADDGTPEVSGFVDGREFVGLRDGDERFASVFEMFAGAAYLWLPFEETRAVKLRDAEGVLDVAYRPAEVRLSDGRVIDAVLPLVYPLSAESGDDFALGENVDWTSEDAGPVCGFGAKVLFVGEEELPLSEVRMIEFRSGGGWGRG